MKNVTTIIDNACVSMSDDSVFVSADMIGKLDDCDLNVMNDVVFDETGYVCDEFHDSTHDEVRDYVAGFITRKLHIQPSNSVKKESWIQVKGGGNFVEPSQEMCNLIKECDVIFDMFHGDDGLKFCHDPIGKVTTLILKCHPTFPLPIVKLFVKVTFFSRKKTVKC